MIGVGFDAFVIVGNASIDLVKKNESNIDYNESI